MTLSLVSYATGKFLPVRQDLVESAEKWGITRLFSFVRQDLVGTSYYRANQSILDEPCGAGLWAWKPFIILQALEKLSDGEVLFYCDAGSRFVNDPAPLVELCCRHPLGLLLFDSNPLTNRQFTKRDCFVKLGCDEPRYWDATKVIATVLVVRKCDGAIRFLREWLNFCQDRAAISDDRNTLGRNLPGFVQHRHDQSILSVLAAKHGIETYRNPSPWGNFLKLPEFRVAGEEVSSPYGLPLGIKTYATQPQLNSPYGTVFEINRLPNFEHKKPFIKPTLAQRWKGLLRPAVRRVRGLLA